MNQEMENHMSKITSLIRRAPKRFSAVVAMVAAAIIIPAVVLGWGPTDRPTYTVENPADHVTFNSITDNPDYGDERNFVRIKDAADTAAGNWKDEITVTGNKEYLVQMYVHNNAADNLNLVALNTNVMANVPNTTGKKVQIDGFISSSNATPNQVWDQAIFSSSQDFNLSYVPGSAILYNNYYGQTGKTLSDGIVTSSGAAVGFNALDGKIPGCFKYSGYVSFKVKAQVGGTINFTTEKSVSKHGANDWSNNYVAQPGETVDYLLEYKNVGTTQQDNVMFRDILPAGVTYVPGTTIVGNSQVPAGAKVSDNVTTTGINAGSYAPGANAWLIFSGKVAAKDDLKCGNNSLVNKVHLSSGGYFKEDDATVTVKTECTPPPVVVKYTCDSLAIKALSRTQFQFTTKYSVENATFKSVTYTIKDASGKTVDTKTSASATLNYTQATAGKYTVQAVVTVSVNGQDKTITSDACKGAFEVPKPPVVVKYTCDSLTVKVLTRTEFQFTTKYTVENATFKSVAYTIKDASGKVVDTKTSTAATLNYTQSTAGKYTVTAIVTVTVNGQDKTVTSDACKGAFEVPKAPKDIPVCDLATKTIITIKESDFDAKKHSRTLSDCTPPVETMVVCELATKNIKTINKSEYDESKYSTDQTKCAETPVTPPELPHTGAGENIVAILGLGSLVAGVAYYIASRRALGL